MAVEIAITPGLLDLAACRRIWQRRFRPAGGNCPHCGGETTTQQELCWKAGGRINCHNCGLWYTWRTGTPFARKGADERKLLLLVSLCDLGLSIPDAARASGLSVASATTWLIKLSEACR